MKKIVFTKVVFMIMLVIFTLNIESIKADSFNVEIRGEGIGTGRATTGKTYTYRLERTIGYPQELVKDLVWTVTHGKIQGANTNKLNVDVIWDKGEFSGTITCANVFKDQENPKITVSEFVNLETIIVSPDINASISVSESSPNIFSKFICSVNYTLSGNTIEYIRWNTDNNTIITSGKSTNTIEVYTNSLGIHIIECEIKLIGIDKIYKTNKTINTIGNDIKILGPKLICPNSSSSYVIQGQPEGSSIEWSTFNDLTIVSGKNASTVIVKSAGSSKNTSLLSAKVTKDGNMLAQRVIEITTTIPTVETISGPSSVSGLGRYSFAADPIFAEGVCDYEWIVGGPSGYTLEQYRHLAYITFSQYGNYNVGCRILQNACTSSQAPTFMTVYVGGRILTIYNDATKTITISENNQENHLISNEFDKKTFFICELYNTANGVMVLRKSVSRNQGVIDVSSIGKGIYIVKIQIDESHYESSKIIIK